MNSSYSKHQSRSVNYYGSIDKARGLRRVADRHSHRRVRKGLNESIIEAVKKDDEPMPVASTSTQQKRKAYGASSLTNRKTM